jgi:hypothetical protein
MLMWSQRFVALAKRTTPALIEADKLHLFDRCVFPTRRTLACHGLPVSRVRGFCLLLPRTGAFVTSIECAPRDYFGPQILRRPRFRRIAQSLEPPNKRFSFEKGEVRQLRIKICGIHNTL